MPRLRVVLEMTVRGAIYGGALGALCGSALGLGIFIAGIIIGLPLGFGVGIFTGTIVGLLASIVTIIFFYPLSNMRLYRLIITITCAIISPIITAAAVETVWFGHFGISSEFALFGVLGFFSSLVFSKRLTIWYITASAFPFPVKHRWELRRPTEHENQQRGA